MSAMFKVNVNNVPDYAVEYKFTVASVCEGELWFYGSWNDLEMAQNVAGEIGGIVVERI